MTNSLSSCGAAVPGWFGVRGVVRVLLALVGAALSAAPASAQFSVQPVIVELRAGPGGVTESLSIQNEAATPLQLRMYASDYDQPEEGGHTFLDLGEHPRTCAGRLTFEPDNLVLGAGESGEVRVRMEPGDSTCWSLLFVQSVSRSSGGIQVAQRIGVKVYGVSTDARPAGEIREVVIGEPGEGGLPVRLAFENLGPSPVRPSGEIEIRSESGEVVGVVPVPPFSVLPGRVSRTEVMVDLGLAPGVYVLVPILDFGGEYLAGGQALLRVGGQ